MGMAGVFGHQSVHAVFGHSRRSKKKVFLYVNFIGYPILYFIGMLLFVPRFGLWGVIGTRMGMGFFLAAVQAAVFTHYMRHENEGNAAK